MLSYLHAFHAGNFADVQKHTALYLALKLMKAKASPISCFDTHAGSALYDLSSPQALKTGEARGGVQALWPHRNHLQAPDWPGFWSCVEDLNPGATDLRFYPGSPAWMRYLTGPDDALTGFELHPNENARLVSWADQHGLQVRKEDGLRGLLRSLPPRTPRLLGLIDPSYEIRKDYREVGETLVKAWRKCRHGVYLVWYPILPDRPHRELLDIVQSSPVHKVLQSELILRTVPARGMLGSGMLVVNPPWGLQERLDAMLCEAGEDRFLAADHRQAWLVPEQ